VRGEKEGGSLREGGKEGERGLDEISELSSHTGTDAFNFAVFAT